MCYHLIATRHEDVSEAKNYQGVVDSQKLESCVNVSGDYLVVACPMPIEDVYAHLKNPQVAMVLVTNDDSGRERTFKRSDGTAFKFMKEYEEEKGRLLVLESKRIGAKVTRKKKRAPATT